MNILAIEATTPHCSVALLHAGNVESRCTDEPQSHSKQLLPMVDECLNAASLQLKDLDAIALTHGPGSFTGIRIGCSAAQGLAFGADLPVIALSTLQVVAQNAYQQHQCQRVAAVLDARMGEVYFAEYQIDEFELMQPLSADCLLAPDQVSIKFSRGIAGSGSLLLPEQVRADLPCYDDIEPTAEGILAHAVQALVEGNTITAEQIEPLYLRNKVTHG